MTRRLTATIIALIAWTGLGIQFGATFASVASITATLWIMVLYFTIIANLAVALVFTNLASGRSKLASPFILGGVTITMVLVGVIYNTLLRGMVELSGGAKLADALNHTVTPVLVGTSGCFWSTGGSCAGARRSNGRCSRWSIFPTALCGAGAKAPILTPSWTCTSSDGPARWSMRWLSRSALPSRAMRWSGGTADCWRLSVPYHDDGVKPA